MVDLILQSDDFAGSLDGITEHIAQSQRHGGNVLILINLGHTVDGFQCVEEKV